MHLLQSLADCLPPATALADCMTCHHNSFGGCAYEKASLAFEQALSIEGDLAARHIAYAKVQEKLGRNKKMIEALEKAVELDPIPQTLNVLADAYERTDQPDLAKELRDKANKLISPEGPAVRRVRQTRRVM